MLYADELDHAVGHFERRAGALKQRTDQSAEDDHDADARERAREAGTDDVGNAADGVAVGVRGVDQRNTGDQAEYQRNGHDREERMDLQLADAEDHQCDGKNEDDDQSNASHRCFLPVFLFLWVFVGRFPCTQYSSAARKIHIEKQQIFSDFLLKITSSSRVSKSRDTCGTQVSLLRSVSIEAGDHALFLSFYPCSISSSGGIARSSAPD